VTIAALLKIGLLQILGTKFHGGSFGSHWGLQSASNLTTLYNRLIAALQEDTPFNVGNAAVLLLGYDGALRLSESEHLMIPPQAS
jgi:hypothetical protein